FEPERLEAVDFLIEVVAFEIEDYVVRRRPLIGNVDRKGRIAVRTLETGVSRERIDNKNKAELLEKLGRFLRFRGVDRNLIEVHRFFSEDINRQRSFSERPGLTNRALAPSVPSRPPRGIYCRDTSR